ncbi:rho-related BTB domain-containing protein 3 [Pelodytes ibericus]
MTAKWLPDPIYYIGGPYLTQRSVRIVLLGNERNRLREDHERQDLATLYLGSRATGLLVDNSHPVFTVYKATLWGNIQVVGHECLSWDIFESDPNSHYIIDKADIIILKYSVNEKTSFLDIKENFATLIKQKFHHRLAFVIVSAIGTPHDDDPSCTCPLCTVDRGICVTTYEGIQLAKELRGPFLELHAVNDFCVGSYFGVMLEYFILQTIKRKSLRKGMKKRKNNLHLMVKPPTLEQPDNIPMLKEELSQYESDFKSLLVCHQCFDVVFCSTNLDKVSEAHRIVLCSISPVFMLLFNIKAESSTDDDCNILRTAHTFFSVCPEDDDPEDSSPVKVIVKDSLLCSYLSDILHFIYSGASQWGSLKHLLQKKMKYHSDVAHVLQRVQCILRIPGKDKCDSDVSSSSSPLKLSDSLGHFFNNLFLADVIFQVQDNSIPAHRAVLAARCDVMAAMFSGSYKEANSLQIPVYGISKDTFLMFLEYLYTDTCCPASILQAISLLICSEMYQVSRLQNMCECYIISQLQSMSSRELSGTSLSVVHLLRKAKLHNSKYLSTWLLCFIAANYLIFSQKKEFQDLSSEERAFVEMHRWPSSIYLKQLEEYRRHIHSQKHTCAVM